MKIPDRIVLKLALSRLVAVDVRQAANVMPLKAAVQSWSGWARNGGL